MKTANDKYLEMAGWLSAFAGLFAGGYALQGVVGNFRVVVPFILFMFSAIMMTYSRKLGRKERVSKIPYFIPIVLFAVDVYVTLTSDTFNFIEISVRSVLSFLSIGALLCLRGREFE